MYLVKKVHLIHLILHIYLYEHIIAKYAKKKIIFSLFFNYFQSKVQLMAASNCGQILQEREDPFDLKVIDISLLIKKKRSIMFFF